MLSIHGRPAAYGKPLPRPLDIQLEESDPLMVRRIRPALAILLLSTSFLACDEPRSSEALLEEAKRLAQQGQPEEALARMRELVAIEPDDPRVQRQYGEALMRTGQPSLAVWPLARAMLDPGEARAAGILLARAQLAAGSADDAAQTATRLIELDPEDPVFYELRSRAHLLLNMEEQAMADIDAAVEHGFEDTATAGFVRVYALLGLDRVEEAEQLLEELHARSVEEVEENPSRAAEVCGATATFAHEKGDDELASERFEACLEGEGLQNRLLVKTALDFYDSTGQHEKGTDILRRRFEADEENLAARVEYAQRLRRGGRADEAEALLLAATETQEPAWAALTDFYLQRQNFEKALDALEHAIASHPKPPDSWRMSQADFLIILGRLDEAERVLEEEIEIEVHRAVVRGRLALARGDLDEATRSLEEAVRMWPDNPDVRYLTANAYERLGDWRKAISHYREAARQERPHVPSSRALADIQKAIGDIDGRAFVLARLLQIDANDADAIEGLLEEARAAGSRDLAQRMFWRLSQLPGMRGRAIAGVARMAARNRGPASGLEAVETARLDLSAPDAFEALEAQSEFLMALDRRDEAIARVSKLIDARPETSALYRHRGALRLAGGEAGAARADFRHALEIEPDSIPAQVGLAKSLEALGETSQAKAAFERAFELEQAMSQHDADAAIAFAQFELRAGDVTAGRKRLAAVLDDQPRNGEAALTLLESLLADGDPEDPSARVVDLAQRAALFEASPRAQEIWARYAPEQDALPPPQVAPEQGAPPAP